MTDKENWDKDRVTEADYKKLMGDIPKLAMTGSAMITQAAMLSLRISVSMELTADEAKEVFTVLAKMRQS
jgi:hypothetical protein